MIVAVALALLAQVSAPVAAPVAAPSSTSSEAVVDPRAVTVDAAPAGSGVSFDPDDPPPVVDLPSDDQLRLLAQRDIAAARPTLRRAARTAERAGTRALAVRLLATNDASVATARICARALRLDVDANVRRAGAECLGRVGPRLGAPHTPALLAALDDPALDVVTMAGWGLANVGDAAAIGALNSRVTHPDVRVGRLFHGYTLRLRERLGLTYAGSNDGTVAPRPSTKDPTAVPPGV
ncbi:MAG TPA: HEAT repeat domain-containing protein, partial [Myxococcota bacterium]